ncbi:hypothetical protein [Polyangium aurulentum]|uniref:hypothetical protein n=1 Tax=Polyangium aurulentum TaxID=2567896 RepID=UPI0010AE0E6C|nr:hypothetical protein [Polyangium aurulentum]UQA59512.1 hypothetical protein E8A73_003085 [Polyangium aurulentum]
MDQSVCPGKITNRRAWPLLAAFVFALGACGGSSGAAGEAPRDPGAEAAPKAGAEASGATHQECEAFIGVVNMGVTKIEEIASAPQDPATDLLRMADTMNAVADACSKLELTVPELLAFQKRYHAMGKKMAKAAYDMIDAAKAKDKAQVESAQKRLDEATREEDPLVDQINAFCHQ